MQPRVTMSQVATRAGVHVTTVSLALRNHPSLPVTTRERLQVLAARMGYHPDPALSSLVAYRSQLRASKNKATLAYLTNWDTRWGWKERPAQSEFFAGAEAKAQHLGYQLAHFWLGEPGLTHKRMSDILYARGINGLILAAQHRRGDFPLALDWSRFCAVKIDFLPHAPVMHNVSNDQRAIIQLAVRRARAAGYRRIGLVMPRWWDSIVDLAWSAGFLAEQQAIDPDDRVPILSFDDPAFSHATPRPLLEEWYWRHRPEVVISYAPFVLPQFAEMDIPIPHDVAYVDLFLTEPDGKLAGVRQNCPRVGEIAVEVLVGQLQRNTFGLPATPTTTLVEGNWHDGDSLPLRRSGGDDKSITLPRWTATVPAGASDAPLLRLGRKAS